MYQINQLQLRVIIADLTHLKSDLATNHCHQQHIAASVLLLVFFTETIYNLYVLPIKPAIFNIMWRPLSLSIFVTQRAVLVCVMEMVGALWVTMAGTVCASWAGGALAVTPLWKLPAVMSRTTTEVKSQTTYSNAF